MVAVPRAIAAAGLTPVFVDCDERLLMDADLVYSHYEAGVYVSVYGRRNEDAVGKLQCMVQFLIEDLAEAHGVRPHQATDAACWSHYANKAIGGQEGGTVWFRDPEHAALARSLRSLGFTAAHDFWHAPRGWNHRMSNAHAELILDSLHWYTHPWSPAHPELGGTKLIGLECGRTNEQHRREIEALYDARCPKEWRMPARDAVWVYDLRLPWNVRLDDVVGACKAAGIEARHSFKPMSQQEEFRGCRLAALQKPTEATWAAMSVMYLPVHPGVTDAAFVGRAFDVIERAVGK